jgi:hypothetical protein
VPRIIVFKSQKVSSTTTLIITWKPFCVQTKNDKAIT